MKLIEIITCDFCYFAGLFNCTHPQYYIKPFKGNCGLFRELPNGEMRVKVNYNLNCSKCGELSSINKLHVIAKGSKYLCEKCYEDK